MAELPTVLVTGGCGFLGTAIVSALLDTNRYSITAIDINPPSLGSPNFSTNRSSSSGKSENTVKYIRCDVLDPQSLSKVFSETRPTAVIHTVGVYPLGTKRYSMKGKEAVFKVNVEGTRNVLEVSRECGVKSFVYTSSVTVVLDELDRDFRNVNETWPTGRVHTSYGQSKAIAENLVLTSNTPSFATCALRSAPIFGPNDATCIPRIHACIAGGETPFILGSGTNMQDFVYIDNVAYAHVLATDKLLASFTEGRPAAAAGETMFITNGEPTTVRDFFLAIWKEFGHVPKFSVVVPEGLVWAMGYAAEWVEWFTGTPGTLCRGVIGDTCRDRYVSIDKARRLLGYEPKIGLEEGIKLSCQHYKTMLEGRRKT